MCWTYPADLSADAGAAAFNSIAGSIGGARAAYLLRPVPVVPDGGGFAPAGSTPTRAGVSTTGRRSGGAATVG